MFFSSEQPFFTGDPETSYRERRGAAAKQQVLQQPLPAIKIPFTGKILCGAQKYLGSILPCASISSSHILTMSSMESSAAVWGSSMAA